MKYVPMAFGLCIATVSAFAGDCTQAGLTMNASMGLGKGGQACHMQAMRPDSPGQRLWLITGENPGPVVQVVIDNGPLLGVNPSGGPRRAICGAWMANTMPEYSWGYPVPDAPAVIIDQSAYDVAGRTATLRIRALDAVHGFEEYSNYSLNVLCLVRLP